VITFHDASTGAVRELVRYGSKNAAIELSALVASRKDVTLISIFIGPQWAASFTFARMAVGSLAQACAAITMPVRPNVIYHWAREEYAHAYELYYKISRYSAFVAVMTAAFLIPFGSDFLRLWIGPRFVTGNVWFRADVVLLILLMNQLPRMIYSMSRQLLFAQNRQKILTILTIADAAVNTTLALMLVRSHGPVGLAIAELIPTLCLYCVAFPFLLRKVAGVSIRRFIRDSVGPPVVGAAAMTAIGFLLRSWMPVHSWGELLTIAVIMAVLSLGIGAIFIVHPDDRRLVLTKVLSLRSRLQPKAAARSS
jgi:O-antigen/teichoic acid export membrane protein